MSAACCPICDVRLSRVEAGTARHALECLSERREIAACAYCQANKGQMHPPHFASPNCESGKRNHCSCDICF